MADVIDIGNVRVDLRRLRQLAHACDPMTCRFTKCCCRSYEVMVDRHEISRVAGCVQDASRYAPGLTEHGGLIDPIDTTEGGHCLNTDEQGECVFAYRTKQGAIRCSIHTLALEWGKSPARIKPKACTLWPLAIHGDDPMLLSVQEDAFAFPCNTRRRPTAKSLHPGVAEIVTALFGRQFLREVEAALLEA
jgi:hypothetical protein